MNLMYILSIGLGIIILWGVGINLANKKKELEEPENRPKLWNYMPHQSKGHAEGVVKNIEFGEKRIMIEMLPRDINIQKELNKDKHFTIKPYKIYFDKKQVDTYANFSSHIPIIIGYPSDPSQLPEEVKQKNPEIIQKIQKNNQLKDESELLARRLQNLKKVSAQTFGGELFTDYVKLSNKLMKEKIDMSKVEVPKPEEKKK